MYGGIISHIELNQSEPIKKPTSDVIFVIWISINSTM